jgi:hypothetical protein
MKFTAILISALLIGCAAIKTEPTLYSTYERFTHDMHSENVQAVYSKYFVQDYMNDPEIRKKILENNKEVFNQFRNYIVKIDSHHERLDGQKGCLTINGYDKDGAPLSLNIEYARIEQHWLIRVVDILYDDLHGFSSKARCPSDYSN